MTERKCQNCKKAIGYLEESYSYYGHVICKECMIKLEKQFGNFESANDDIETEILIAEEGIEQGKDEQYQTPKIDESSQRPSNEQGNVYTPKLGKLNIQNTKEAIMSTDERMKKMERQLARVKWINCGLIACIVISLGVSFISKAFGSGTVLAKRFIVEDEHGKARAILGISKEESAALGVGENSPCLMMSDENGMPLIMMVMSEKGSKLILSGENGKGGASVSVNRNESAIWLSDGNQKKRATLVMLEIGPMLCLSDENEEPRVYFDGFQG